MTAGERSWKCPICGKEAPAGASTFPFCSDRCRLIDLGRWLDGTYVERATADTARLPTEDIPADEL